MAQPVNTHNQSPTLVTRVIPPLFAVIILLTGTIMLFTGVLPGAAGRMTWLRQNLPLSTIELSQFLSSLIGAGLLILSRGLQRRLDAAYHLTVGLLACGALVSLTKGLNVEEAVIQGLMLLALIPSKKQFYRKASLLDGSMSPAWMIWVCLVLMTSIWLGSFMHRHTAYRDMSWWQFAWHEDAPRMLRTSVGAVVLLLCYGLLRLLRGKVPPLNPPTRSEIDQVTDLIKTTSRSNAHLALLGDKRFMFNAAQDTFIMYAIEGRSWIALGDPVGPQENWNGLLWDFCELCDRYDDRPAFYQVPEESIDEYRRLGMKAIKLGEEAYVDLKSFSLEGSDRKDLRYARRKLTKSGYGFEVVPAPQSSDFMTQLGTISNAWLDEKHAREKRFSLGYFQSDYISQCPIAVVRHENRIIAFTNLWTRAQHEELGADLMRYFPEDSPNEIMDYLFTELLLWGQAQGYRWFDFGMAPLSGLHNRHLAPFWSLAGAFVFRIGEHFYNFQGLRAYKDKFKPVWRPKYLIYPSGCTLPRVLSDLVSLISGGLKGTLMK